VCRLAPARTLPSVCSARTNCGRNDAGLTSTRSRWHVTAPRAAASAMMLSAWAVRNSRQVGPHRRGPESAPASCRIVRPSKQGRDHPGMLSTRLYLRSTSGDDFRAVQDRSDTSRLLVSVAR
jgi:hypothetical protein